MTKVSAFVVVHERTERSPAFTLVGFAMSVQVGALGGGGGGTVTRAVQITCWPPEPVAVSV
jgi:hypothetical protein